MFRLQVADEAEATHETPPNRAAILPRQIRLLPILLLIAMNYSQWRQGCLLPLEGSELRLPCALPDINIHGIALLTVDRKNNRDLAPAA